MLLVGLGAVSTTTIAGVLAIRRGLAKPIGSLTQMGTVRLGKRTEGRSPQISDFVPLAGLDDLVFGGWDIFEDDCYAAAKTAGVLETIAARSGAAASSRPSSRWPAVFDRRYVKRLDGPNVKNGQEQARSRRAGDREDIRSFKAAAQARSARDGLVRQHRSVHDRVGGAHQTVGGFERALEANDPAIPSSMVYAYAAIKEGHPVRERGAQPAAPTSLRWWSWRGRPARRWPERT